MLLPHLQYYQKKLATLGQRQLIILAGNRLWQNAQIEKIIYNCHGDWITLSDCSQQKYAIMPEKAASLLGREFLHGIFDANDAFNTQALAILTGTLKAGSWLILCLPNIEAWDKYIDNDSQRWNDAQGIIATPYFMSWLKDISLANNRVIFLQAPQSISSNKILPTLAEQIQPWFQPQGLPTKEQETILKTLLKATTGIYSVIAPRGRGKSALAGMLIEQWPGSVTVCAPTKNSIDILSSHTNKTLSFYSPDNLLALCYQDDIHSDWLIIDEAAMLPIAQLIALCTYFPRVLMTTTVQGYEGTGRGFILKLGDSLPLLEHFQLETPIRFAINDPLECWLNKLLLLDELNDNNDKQQGNITISRHLANWLENKEHLESFYQLLTSAHYRTTPLDLRRIFDGQKQHFWSACINQKQIGAVWCIEEGDLSQELAQEVWLGNRRPRGNLVAQSLVSYGLTPDAMRLASLRISRIAVLPQYRRQKVAVSLIKTIVDECLHKQIDYLSVSFGYTKVLAQFWRACGFHLVRLGIHKEASSGCYTAMAIYPLTEKGESLLKTSLMAFKYQYPQIYYQTGIHLLDDIFPTDLLTQEDNWQLMAGFAFAHRQALTVYSCMAAFLFDEYQHFPLLVTFFIDRKSEQHCIEQFALSSKKVLLKTLRQQCAQLMTKKNPQLTQHYQQWITQR